MGSRFSHRFPTRDEAVAAAVLPRLEGVTQTAADLLKVPQAAELVGVSERTIRDWIDRGLVPAVQPAGKGHAVRIDRRELLRSDRRDAGAVSATTSRSRTDEAA
jgi:excisionase family DNA binding protein